MFAMFWQNRFFLLSSVKTSGRCFQIFVVFSEKLDFMLNSSPLTPTILFKKWSFPGMLLALIGGCKCALSLATRRGYTSLWDLPGQMHSMVCSLVGFIYILDSSFTFWSSKLTYVSIWNQNRSLNGNTNDCLQGSKWQVGRVGSRGRIEDTAGQQ